MVEAKKVLAVGIIGAGLQGCRRAGALSHFEDRISMVADSDLDRAQSLAATVGCEATTNWEDVVGDDSIDAVIVCTPPNLHEQICVAASRQGKHVLCEKPLTRTPEEATRVLAAARQSGIKLKCGFNHRHHPGIQQAKKWLDQGSIGEPTYIRSVYGIGGRQGYEQDWRANVEISGGGQMMDQGLHVIDLARWFLGEFEEVSGFVQTAYWDIAPLEDNAFCLLRTQKGQVASIHVSWTQWKNQFSFHVFGTDGYVTVDGLGGSYGVEKAALGKRVFLEPFREEVVEFRGEDRSWEEEWREFAGAISEDREPLANGEDGLEAIRIAHAVYEAASKGGVKI